MGESVLITCLYDFYFPTEIGLLLANAVYMYLESISRFLLIKWSVSWKNAVIDVRTAKVQASLHIRAASPELMLFAHVNGAFTLRKHAYSNKLNILQPKKENFRWGGSNEYPQSMFLSKNKKNNVYPVNPSFTI